MPWFEIAKAFHIIAMVTWFAGLFYLPRLFVYHAMTTDQAGLERFKTMERKLYRGIMTPSMVVAVGLGLWLLIDNWAFYREQGWMHAKLALAILLIGYHHACLFYLKKFAADSNTRGHVFFRWFNEVPVLFLVAMVVLAVVRPF